MPNHQPEKQFEEPEIEKEAVEQPEGIEELKERVEQLESQLKKEKIPVPEEKERMVKQEIKNYLQEMQETPSFAAPPATRDETEEIEKFPPSQQVGALVSLVFEKGLKEAISVAKALENPALMDEFHDTLVDRYYQELVEKGVLEPM